MESPFLRETMVSPFLRKPEAEVGLTPCSFNAVGQLDGTQGSPEWTPEMRSRATGGATPLLSACAGLQGLSAGTCASALSVTGRRCVTDEPGRQSHTPYPRSLWASSFEADMCFAYADYCSDGTCEKWLAPLVFLFVYISTVRHRGMGTG